ncbi:hypothetical protein JCM15457_2164 [Liquorilactobacillus sucicola DSM 21376 = JCM 15457]|uniref:WxL domain-containing protein n=1 Tax=Liquorilactobacillus sucicola DSM 21376 = JCM 15457 TaxID=1423806 RepID=A0A023D0D1_9LACO|nr:hypothetical protein [Liquorilactobacillus sucicola]KRN06557.1 hypothetical protein FD15_GL000104 [Liquorilactobacillus sucicola DSM 21376 = JCM 15457]GAJ27195.1 hypothetical protein JCM15457_2164 [Liquorilactobacillus sucicola DSM 21376 = JCM 15457]
MLTCSLHKTKLKLLLLFLCAFLFSIIVLSKQVTASATPRATPAGDLAAGKAGFTTQPYTISENGQTYLKFSVVISYQNVKYNNKIDVTIFTGYDNFNTPTWVTDQASYTHKENGAYSELAYTVNISQFKNSSWLLDNMRKDYFVGVNAYNNPWCQQVTYYSNIISGQISSSQIHITSAPNSILGSNEQYNSASAQVTPNGTTDPAQWSASSDSIADLNATFLNNGKSSVDSTGKALTKFNVPLQSLLTKVNTDTQNFGFPLELKVQSGSNYDTKNLYLGGLKAINSNESVSRTKGLTANNIWNDALDPSALSQLFNNLAPNKYYWYTWFYWPEDSDKPVYLGAIPGVANAAGPLRDSSSPTKLEIKDADNDNNFITQAVQATRDHKPLSLQLVVYANNCQKWYPWNIVAASNRAQISINPVPQTTPELVSVPAAFDFGSIPVRVIANGDSTKNYTAQGKIAVKNANHSWHLTAEQTRPFTDDAGNSLKSTLALNGANLGNGPQVIYAGSSTTPAAFSTSIQSSLAFPSGVQNKTVNAGKSYGTTISWNLTVSNPTLSAAH